MCEIDLDLNFDVIFLWKEELFFKVLEPKVVLSKLLYE